MVSLLTARLKETLEVRDGGTIAGDCGDQKCAEWEWELKWEEWVPFPAPQNGLSMDWGVGSVIKVLVVKLRTGVLTPEPT